MTADIPFDAITTMLVFMVGVPAVLLQSLAPELRQVVTKRWERLLVTAGIPVLIGAGLALGGVFLHDSADDPNLLWSSVLASLFVLAGFTAFRIPQRYGRREAVVQRLEREVAKPLHRQGRLAEESLHDLIELGRQSEVGPGKEWVLQALFRLSDTVGRHPKYTGDGLEDLVLGVVEIVAHAEPHGSPENFSTATKALRCVVVPEAANSRDLKQGDLICAIRALSSLGRASLAFENHSVSLAIVQSLGPTHAPKAESLVSQALFEIGVEAVEKGQTLIGMAALHNLMTLVEGGSVADGELAADTLGLIAHFWKSGETGRDYVAGRLETLAEVLDEERSTALVEASQHCARTSQFRTADLLRQMDADLQRAADSEN